VLELEGSVATESLESASAFGVGWSVVSVSESGVSRAVEDDLRVVGGSDVSLLISCGA